MTSDGIPTSSPGNAVEIAPARLSIREFLEGVPPGSSCEIHPLSEEWGSNRKIPFEDIALHCPSDECQGIRAFRPLDDVSLAAGASKNSFVRYLCRNCVKHTKVFALSVTTSKDGPGGKLLKYGETPGFGPPIPSRLMSLIGPDREYFLKGRRAENQGLGIAAFAYYRRVVENQKSRIIEEVIRVAVKLGASPVVVSDLQAALKETQFSRAVDAIKHGIPQALLVQGHNPLTLLHSALSDGLHAKSDEHCLQLATSIRIVLTDLVERMSAALRDDNELSDAVKTLLNISAKKAEERQVDK